MGRKLGILLFDTSLMEKLDHVVAKITDPICYSNDGDEEFKLDETRMIVDSTPAAELTPIRELPTERFSVLHVDNTVCRIKAGDASEIILVAIDSQDED